MIDSRTRYVVFAKFYSAIFSLQLSNKVLAIVDLLLESGANVDVVAQGHSPLSLAITNGHDKVWY